MSNHHQGLIAVAEDAQKRGSAAVRPDAARLAEQQRREQQEMVQHLSAEYGARHQPVMMEQARMMADSLKQISGEHYAQRFYQGVVKHHQQGLQIHRGLEHLDDFRRAVFIHES